MKKKTKKYLSDMSIWTVFIAVGIGLALWPISTIEAAMLFLLVLLGWVAVLAGMTDD